MKNKYLIFIFLFFSYALLGQNKASINASIKTAKMLERKGDVDGAIAIYEAVLLKDPKNHRTIRDLKSILKINQRYDEGILFIRKRLIHAPNDLHLYSELGELYFLNGQLKDAKTIWTAGAEKFRNNRSYYQIMVSLYSRLSLDKELIPLLDTGRKKFGQSFVVIQNQLILKALPSFKEAIQYLESKKGAYLVQEVNDQPDAQTTLLLQ